MFRLNRISRRILYCCLVLIIVALLISCSDLDGGNGNGNGTYPENGVYQLIEEVENEDGEIEENLLRQFLLTDGQYRLEIYSDGVVSSIYEDTYDVWYLNTGRQFRVEWNGSTVMGTVDDSSISIRLQAVLGDNTEVVYTKISVSTRG